MDLRHPILMDGATGTELQKLGMPAGTATALWAAEHPEAICSVYRSYLSAGTQFLIAATFGANRAALKAYHAENRVSELNHSLVALAKDCAAGRAIIAGDLSPTGWLCAPLGDQDFEQVYEVYREQAAALEEAGVDCYLIETQMALSDLRAAMLAVRTVSQKPILVSVTADSSGRLPYGSDMTACLVTAQAMGAAVFGLNCSFGPEEMAENLLKLSPYAKIPLSCKANAGMPQQINGNTVYDCPTQAYTQPVPALYEAGVRLFGGCCGSTPAHIAALHNALQKLPKKDFIPCQGEWLASEQAIFPASGAYEVTHVDAQNLEDVIDEIPELDGPLCVDCNDTAVLEQLLRHYQGRAGYAGRGIDPAVLEQLAEKYGLLVI